MPVPDATLRHAGFSPYWYRPVMAGTIEFFPFLPGALHGQEEAGLKARTQAFEGGIPRIHQDQFYSRMGALQCRYPGFIFDKK